MDVVERLKVLRSKNAGPFVITLDVVFTEQSDFDIVRQALSADGIASAYRIDRADVLSYDFLDELKAAKISFRRRRPCGHPGDPDCYGMNQEEPLAGLLRELVSH